MTWARGFATASTSSLKIDVFIYLFALLCSSVEALTVCARVQVKKKWNLEH